MNRNFLYAVVAFLGIALGLVYTQKKNPDFFTNLIGNKSQVESWRKEDPGWTKDNFPNSGPAPVAPVEPAAPKVEPTPPQPQQPQPKTQPNQPPRRLCPPNG
jgi:hypothetical protein